MISKRMLTIITLMFVLGAALLLSAAKFVLPEPEDIRVLMEEADSMPPPSGTVHADLAYTQRIFNNKRLDLYEPLVAYEAGKAPLVVFFHGGSWLYGDKVTIRIIDRFLDRMRRQGYFVAAVNYTDSIARGLMGPVENGIESVRWLREKAPEYGYDPDTLALYGVSAGAHVALMSEIAFRDQGCIAMVLAECAPSDLVAMAAGEAFQASDTLARLPENYLRRFSPVFQVDAGMPPVLIYHGDADTTVHVDQSRRLFRAIIDAGAHAELEIYKDGTHAFLGMPDSLWYEQETRALEFMDSYLH
jgi:acetyl esterase/lipase